MKVFFVAFLCCLPLKAQEIFKQKTHLMGCNFEITVVATNQAQANNYINLAIAEITRIEKLISSWDPTSETSKINKNAGGKPVVVSDELIQLVIRAKNISKITDGAFDVSYASMDKVWFFNGSMQKMPSAEAIKNSVKNIDFQNIIIDETNHTIFLKNKGMKIGFGAIGKGYAADKAKQLLVKNGISAGIINASGDMNAWGKQPNGKAWQVAVTNPLNKNKAFAFFPIENSAVVTSGNYEKFVVFDNKRYSHIIDPRTGYPTTELASCTVFAPKAELADALATSVFVMGTKIGLHFINQLPDIECILVNNSGTVFYSDNIKKEP